MQSTFKSMTNFKHETQNKFLYSFGWFSYNDKFELKCDCLRNSCLCVNIKTCYDIIIGHHRCSCQNLAGDKTSYVSEIKHFMSFSDAQCEDDTYVCKSLHLWKN